MRIEELTFFRFVAAAIVGISALKRAYGLKRCNWKGVEHSNSYVWSSVVAINTLYNY